jgi:predicted membrane protein
LFLSLYVLNSVLWCPLRFPLKNYVRLVFYLQLFVGGIMSYLRYLCLFTYSGVQILCCVFVLFVFVLCTLCFQCLWIVHFLLHLWYSLTFIYPVNIIGLFKQNKCESTKICKTTMRKQIQQIRYEPSYKQLEDQRTTSCYAEIVTDIKPRNSERKDT